MDSKPRPRPVATVQGRSTPAMMRHGEHLENKAYTAHRLFLNRIKSRTNE